MDLALRSYRRPVGVTMNCDDTYPVEYIEPMARMVLDEGYDLVDGLRLEHKPAATPCINYLANFRSGVPARIDDNDLGFRQNGPNVAYYLADRLLFVIVIMTTEMSLPPIPALAVYKSGDGPTRRILDDVPISRIAH